MLYAVAFLMGGLLGIGHRHGLKVAVSPAGYYASPLIDTLVFLGGLSGFICILPASYMFGAGHVDGRLVGIGWFLLTSFIGYVAVRVLIPRSLDPLLSLAVFPLNIALAVFVFFATR